MLSNVADLSDVLAGMTRDGLPVTPALAACTSPYIRGHIRRFGRYSLRRMDVPPPLNPGPVPWHRRACDLATRMFNLPLLRTSDDEHRWSMGRQPAAGNARGAVARGEATAPAPKCGRRTSCVRPVMQMPRKNRAAAQTQGITNCATARRRIVKIVNTQIVGTGTVSLDVSAPWPELFVPERLRRLLSTAVHNQYRCGAYCSR